MIKACANKLPPSKTNLTFLWGELGGTNVNIKTTKKLIHNFQSHFFKCTNMTTLQ